VSDITAITIAAVCLYSTGHWIGATVLVAWLLWGLLRDDPDPLGILAQVKAMRRYARTSKVDAP
jgi:hypothetical protein